MGVFSKLPGKTVEQYETTDPREILCGLQKK
jgi:hypothetical protein